MTLTTTTTAASAESQAKMEVKGSGGGGGGSGEENLPTSEMDLLAKLEAANKLIESDAKSLNSLHSTHSRKNSDTSQISLTSSKFQASSITTDRLVLRAIWLSVSKLLSSDIYKFYLFLWHWL